MQKIEVNSFGPFLQFFPIFVGITVSPRVATAIKVSQYDVCLMTIASIGLFRFELDTRGFVDGGNRYDFHLHR